MALNRSDKSRILRRYFPGMTRNSEMSTEPSLGGRIPWHFPDRCQSVPSGPILRKLPVRSSGLLWAWPVSWLWGLRFTGRATTSVSVGELHLAPWAGLSSWS